MGPVRAVSPAGVLDAIGDLVRSRRGRVRPAVDGAPAADPHRLGADLLTALDPVGPGAGVLPWLRDPDTDRWARARRVMLPGDGVVVVSGSVLLGRALPFDLGVHLRLSPAALARRTPQDQAWTLPALRRYLAERDPEGTADLVVRIDDPRHPAIGLRSDR